MLELNNISKFVQEDFWKSPKNILDKITFKVSPQKITGFVGHNGAGKTTCFKIIMGLINASSGNVNFDKSLGANRNEILKNIGYFPEKTYFYQNIKGIEFLRLLSKLTEMSQRELDESLMKWVEKFKISHLLNRKISTYSKGQQQRLGLLSSIIHNPNFIILDEPMSGLDPVGRKDIKEILKELKEEGKTIFFSTHILGDVEELCENIIVLEKGVLKFNGSLDEINNLNEQNQYHIKYNLKGKGFEVDVPGYDKDKEIREIIEQGGSISCLRPKIKTLEEIIYKI